MTDDWVLLRPHSDTRTLCEVCSMWSTEISERRRQPCLDQCSLFYSPKLKVSGNIAHCIDVAGKFWLNFFLSILGKFTVTLDGFVCSYQVTSSSYRIRRSTANLQNNTEVYLEPGRTFMRELFCENS